MLLEFGESSSPAGRTVVDSKDIRVYNTHIYVECINIYLVKPLAPKKEGV